MINSFIKVSTFVILSLIGFQSMAAIPGSLPYCHTHTTQKECEAGEFSAPFSGTRFPCIWDSVNKICKEPFYKL